MSRSIFEAWRVNEQVNRVLLEYLTADMLQARTPGGGYTVAQHLAHLAGSLKYWGSHLDEADMGNLPDLFDPQAEAFVAEADPERIRNVMRRTAEKVLEVVEAQPQGYKGELPHRSVEAFLLHMLVHDAHHRGQILLALKTAGYPLPDEDALWSPWRGG